MTLLLVPFFKLRHGGSWFGVTYPEDKPIVVASIKKLVDSGGYPAPLWG